MLWTKSFLFTMKEAPEEAESISHRLMLRTGMVKMLVSGVYSYLPFGYKALNNVMCIIRQEMKAVDAEELLLPALQPLELWQRTGRDKLLGEVMIQFQDRRGRRLCLGPTHEEVITDLVSKHIQSYRDLPLVLYQIQTKFRDELRPRFGIVRACEFFMKDAYSFDKDMVGLCEIYDKMYTAYENIFRRCGLDFVSIQADSGVIGGDVSHEFLVPADSGEDTFFQCEKCACAFGEKEIENEKCSRCGTKVVRVNAMEVGHIFQLGNKYSDAFNLKYLDESGNQQSVQMGCYGIGVSRLLPAIIEQNHDADGIIWPKDVAPCKVLVLPVNVSDGEILEAAVHVYARIEKKNISVILDDRDQRAGIKFKDADLLGIPYRITIGNKFKKEKKFEVKQRDSKKIEFLDEQQLDALLNDL